MMRSRRGFLSFLGAAIAGATLDSERLLWEPGKKLISIPNPNLLKPGDPIFDEITTCTLAYMQRAVVDDAFFVQAPWLHDIYRHVR